MPVDRGIVEYFGCSRDEHNCGYCKGKKPALSDFGMWAHQLKPLEYLQLMERGWRRSGKYCYKPILNRTCCPTYPIRCDASNFIPSRSQKKNAKRFYHFLKEGRIKGLKNIENSEESLRPSSSMSIDHCIKEGDETPAEMTIKMQAEETLSVTTSSGATTSSSIEENNSKKEERTTESTSIPSSSLSLSSKGSKRMNTEKAKVRRFEAKISKIMSRESCDRELAVAVARQEREEKLSKKVNQKSLEDLMSFIAESADESVKYAHRLSIKFVSTSFVGRDDQEREFKRKFLDAEHVIYEKYQKYVHQDEPDECNKKQFTRFLVDSPILFTPFRSQLCHLRYDGLKGFGSYHMQYWLDKDKLLAVSVIDILPTGVSSVYFFYDPNYSSLGLGTYSALQELLLTRDVMKVYLPFRYYYMGFYIHSCPKMRYKGKYHPSYLLCPEAKTWHLIKKVLPLLDRSKYSRLEPDESKLDEDSRSIEFEDIGILYAKHGMTNYSVYLSVKQNFSSEEKVREYSCLVGKKTCKSLLLYLE